MDSRYSQIASQPLVTVGQQYLKLLTSSKELIEFYKIKEIQAANNKHPTWAVNTEIISRHRIHSMLPQHIVSTSLATTHQIINLFLSKVLNPKCTNTICWWINKQITILKIPIWVLQSSQSTNLLTIKATTRLYIISHNMAIIRLLPMPMQLNRCNFKINK